jgi:hypothetical protein
MWFSAEEIRTNADASSTVKVLGGAKEQNN